MKRMNFGDPFRITCADCGIEYYNGDRNIARFFDGYWRCKECGVKLLEALLAMAAYMGLEDEGDEEGKAATTAQLRLDGR